MTNIETLEAITGNDHKPEGKIIDRHKIEGTPFWIISMPDNTYNIVMGRWKLNEKPIEFDHDYWSFKDTVVPEDIAWKWLYDNQWNIITSMIICINEDIKNQQTN